MKARGFAIHHVKVAMWEKGEIVIQRMSGVNDNTGDNGNTSFLVGGGRIFNTSVEVGVYHFTHFLREFTEIILELGIAGSVET